MNYDRAGGVNSVYLSTSIWLGLGLGLTLGLATAGFYGIGMNLTFAGLYRATPADLLFARLVIVGSFAVMMPLLVLSLVLPSVVLTAYFPKRIRGTVVRRSHALTSLAICLLSWMMIVLDFNIRFFESELVNRVTVGGFEIRSAFLSAKVWALNAMLLCSALCISIPLKKVLAFTHKRYGAMTGWAFAYSTLACCLFFTTGFLPLNKVLPNFISLESICWNAAFVATSLLIAGLSFSLSLKIILSESGKSLMFASTVWCCTGLAFLLYLGSTNGRVPRDYITKQSPWVSETLVRSIASIADVDGDGYSAFTIVKDSKEGDASVNHFAIDIPDNGVDEDGVAGDLTKSTIEEMIENLHLTTSRNDLNSNFSKLHDNGELNIIIVKMDGLRQDRMPGRSHPRTASNSLVSFVEDGVECVRAITPSTGTSGATYSLLMSMSPVSHRLTAWSPDDTRRIFGSKDSMHAKDRFVKPKDLAEILSSVDYNTIGISGGHYSYPSRTGFQEFIDPETEPLGIKVGDLGRSYLNAEEVRLVFESKFTKVLEEKQNQFFFIGFHEPHAPFDLERGRELLGKSTGVATAFGTTDEDAEFMSAAYDANIEYVTDQFSKLCQFLKEKNEYSNSLVVLFSDHGEEFLDHGGMYHISNLYRELTDVVLVFKFPMELAAGQKPQQLVSLIDIAPTILDAIGLRGPKSFEGRSITPLLDSSEKRDKKTDWRSHVRMDLLFDSQNVRFAIESQQFKYIHNFSNGIEELYDRRIDWKEQNNVIDSYPEIANQLKKLLFNWKSYDELRSRGLIE